MSSTRGDALEGARPWLILKRTAELVRWPEWYDSKLAMFVAAMFYAQLGGAGSGGLGQMAVLFLLLCQYAAFGHLINDYADRDADRAAGKRRLLAGWSEGSARVAVAVPLVGGLALALTFLELPAQLLTAAAYAAATAYSLPPFRLKERGVLGWAAAAVAQRTLPVAIVFEAFRCWDAAAIAFCVLMSLIGLRFIVIHQLFDAAHDRRAGIRTAGTERSAGRLLAIIHFIFALELASACATVGFMATVAPLSAVPAVAYGCYLVLGRLRGEAIVPVSYFVLGPFYHVLWPLSLGVLAAARDPALVAAVMVALALAWEQIRTWFER